MAVPKFLLVIFKVIAGVAVVGIAVLLGSAFAPSRDGNASWDSPCGERNTEGSLACWPFREKLAHGCDPGSFQVGSWVP
jgi:hypothetical protein